MKEALPTPYSIHILHQDHSASGSCHVRLLAMSDCLSVSMNAEISENMNAEISEAAER